MPVATFLEEELIEENNCDYPGSMAKFFSKSCVPGALDAKYNSFGTNPNSLCSLCVGNEGKANFLVSPLLDQLSITEFIRTEF